ncbi:cytochrome P450 [Mycobacterium ahvazicum]|uniref:Cytochrome P450 n=1 Tax=Mycobacterium ahvazicum TaxID=1964395 RepID=A0A2K4YH22_9MYCO|nr:cytochrome P450 [Mycobacterium ahvazicum]SOX56068.1 cytochrome P450 [Mycobacterium ahvazicum]
MTASTAGELYYDPYDVALNTDPFAMFRRLREEAPLYYNAHHDFYALSRFDDVSAALVNHEVFSSARGAILEIIRADMSIPSGLLIFEDPPVHDIHRNLLSRVFTPRRIGALEPQIRQMCAEILAPAVQNGGFDFVTDVGLLLPVRVVGKLFGIPEGEQDRLFQKSLSTLDNEPGQPLVGLANGEVFADYVDWRAKNPSDDLLTELMNAEFTDESGVVRRLSGEELLLYLTVVATAGADTTTRLIGAAGKLLADHPDQRRDLVDDRSLIGQAVEEIVRFEPPAVHVARYVTRDIELHGQTVQAGSVVILLLASANRDDRRFVNGDTFDVHRKPRQHLGFGVGTHYCLGNALARLEGRVALDEILNRFPEWRIDESGARYTTTSLARGWASLPVFVS